MSHSDRTAYKTPTSSLPHLPDEHNTYTARNKRDILPYRALNDKPIEHLTNFERFMKSKLDSAPNLHVQQVIEPSSPSQEKRQPARAGNSTHNAHNTHAQPIIEPAYPPKEKRQPSRAGNNAHGQSATEPALPRQEKRQPSRADRNRSKQNNDKNGNDGNNGKFPLILETKEPETRVSFFDSVKHKKETPTPQGLTQFLRVMSARKPSSRSRSQGKICMRKKQTDTEKSVKNLQLKKDNAKSGGDYVKENLGKESVGLDSTASFNAHNTTISTKAFRNTRRDSRDLSKGMWTQNIQGGSNFGSLNFLRENGQNESLTARYDLNSKRDSGDFLKVMLGSTQNIQGGSNVESLNFLRENGQNESMTARYELTNCGLENYEILKTGGHSTRNLNSRTEEREKAKGMTEGNNNRSRFGEDGSRSTSRIQIIDIPSLQDLQTTRADFDTAPHTKKIDKEGKVPEFSYLHSQRALSSRNVSKRKLSDMSQGKVTGRSKRGSAVLSLGIASSMRTTPTAAMNNSTKNNSQDTSLQHELKRDYIPDWLDKRPDFKETCKEYAIEAREIVPRTCSKPSYNRTEEEIEAIMAWLQKIHMFRVLPQSVLRNIAEKLKHRMYMKDQILCEQGEQADCLYIIFNGTVNCIVNGSQVAIYKGGDVVGQTALDSAVPRTATLVAVSKCSVLRLEKTDYAFTMEYYALQQKADILATVKKVKVFESMDESKQSRVVAFLQSKYYSKGDVIYREGDNAESLFIVKQGLVSVESSVSIEKENLWPAGMSLWEKYTQVRDTKFSHMIKPNTYFGHTELLDNTRRLSTAVCVEDAHVLILNKRDFFGLMDADDIARAKYLVQNSSVGDVDKIRKKIIQTEREKNKMKRIMVKAITEDLGPLNQAELKRRTEKVVEPTMERIKHDFRTYIKQSTVKVVRKYEKVPHNLD